MFGVAGVVGVILICCCCGVVGRREADDHDEFLFSIAPSSFPASMEWEADRILIASSRATLTQDHVADLILAFYIPIFALVSASSRSKKSLDIVRYADMLLSQSVTFSIRKFRVNGKVLKTKQLFSYIDIHV